VTLVFFATPALSVEPANWSAAISRNDEVVVSSQAVVRR
jgi:hypothetical protein